MNHSYRIFLIILCAFLFNKSNACTFKSMLSDGDKEIAKYLLIWDKYDNFVSFAISERPCITIDQAKGLVNCVTTKQDISFPIKDVHKYTMGNIDDVNTNISDAVREKGELRKSANAICFYNCEPGTVITIYDISGLQISSFKTDNDGFLEISTNNLQNGMYLIKLGKTTYKITIK